MFLNKFYFWSFAFDFDFGAAAKTCERFFLNFWQMSMQSNWHFTFTVSILKIILKRTTHITSKFKNSYCQKF